MGKHFALKAVCEPKPLQKPHPPITVGGSGDMLLRKATAPYADRLDFGFLPSVKFTDASLLSYRRRAKRLAGILGRLRSPVGRAGKW